MNNSSNIKTGSINSKEIKGYRGIYNLYLKRVFDLIFALVFLIPLIPVYFVIAICIIAETGFPVFYKADRGGYKGETFKIYKFRTMVKDADKIGGGTTALNDSRITKVGGFLRKTKLDEIAQLFNIIKGEMSFIGPRPELLKYTNQYTGLEEYILKVRPGITDYSSIEFINLDEIVGGANADEIYEKVVLKKKNQLRIKYAATVSMKTDMNLFLTTVLRVFKKAFKHVSHIEIEENK
jgi:lipopolysaccharide/colanic/teichoic acid biosynthesis glycosyltransferase